MRIINEGQKVAELASRLESALEEAKDGGNIPLAATMMAKAIITAIAKIELKPEDIQHS